MPIPYDMRKQLYSGETWEAVREKVKQRAGDPREKCSARNGARGISD